MRRSREEAAETRRRIVEAASRLFRARGIDAVSVADVMSSLGLTVGGFYRHFDSKEALVAESIDAASQAGLASTTREEQLSRYLSLAHRANLAGGCPVAALCSEMAHQARAPRNAFTKALERMLARIGGGRKRQLRTAAAMVGALVLARATPDEALAAELLETVAEDLRK